jgi:hypothetical protein
MGGEAAGPAVLLGAGFALVVAVVAGTVAHELAHALVLRTLGVPYRIEWLPDREEAGMFRAGLRGRWATVNPCNVPRGLSPWRLRVAALAPLGLATPLALALLGVLPDPFQTGNPYAGAAAIGWLACALPSPQDFSVVWYAERAIVRDRPHDEHRDGRP